MWRITSPHNKGKESLNMKKIIITITVIIGLIVAALGGSYATFQGSTNLDSLILSGNLYNSGYYATTTSASATTSQTLPIIALSQKAIIYTSGTSTDVTLTLPASSSIGTLLPNVGDSTSFIIHNASTTGSILTIAAGTGNTLLSASTTAIILAGGISVVDVIKVSATKIVVALTPTR